MTYSKDFFELNRSIMEIMRFCKKWGRIPIINIEDDYSKETIKLNCDLGYPSLLQLTHPGNTNYNPYPRWLMLLDINYLSKFFQLRPIYSIFYNYHKFIYKLAYRKSIEKRPNLKEKILYSSNFKELLENL